MGTPNFPDFDPARHAVIGGRGVLTRLFNPPPETIDFGALVMSLARQRRYRASVNWSVAAHTVLAYQIAVHLGLDDAHRKAVLLHDMREGIALDIMSPVIGLMADMAGHDHFGDIENSIQQSIHDALGFGVPASDTGRMSGRCDYGAHIVEAAHFFPWMIGPTAKAVAEALKPARQVIVPDAGICDIGFHEHAAGAFRKARFLRMNSFEIPDVLVGMSTMSPERQSLILQAIINTEFPNALSLFARDVSHEPQVRSDLAALIGSAECRCAAVFADILPSPEITAETAKEVADDCGEWVYPDAP